MVAELPQGHVPLSPELLVAAGELGRLGREIHCFHVIDSTNQWLLNAAERLPDGALATAEFQTAGRGRLGRAWLAPRGAALLLSILLHERETSPWPRLATMLGAVAACEAVSAVTVCRPRIRWPNDIVLGQRKLGGVLAETRGLNAAAMSAPAVAGEPGAAEGRRTEGSPPGGRALVLGIGLNCLQQRGHFPAELAEKATSLELESPAPIDRRAVAAALVARLDYYLARPTGPAEATAAWRGLCRDVGHGVTLEENGQQHRGVIVDIMADGDLLVRFADGAHRVFSAATTTRVW